MALSNAMVKNIGRERRYNFDAITGGYIPHFVLCIYVPGSCKSTFLHLCN